MNRELPRWLDKVDQLAARTDAPPEIVVLAEAILKLAHRTVDWPEEPPATIQRLLPDDETQIGDLPTERLSLHYWEECRRGGQESA